MFRRFAKKAFDEIGRFTSAAVAEGCSRSSMATKWPCCWLATQTKQHNSSTMGLSHWMPMCRTAVSHL
jgi:hypothetical protein